MPALFSASRREKAFVSVMSVVRRGSLLSSNVAEFGRADQRLTEAAQGGQRRVGPVGLLFRQLAIGALVVGEVIRHALDLLFRRRPSQRRAIGRIDALLVALLPLHQP